MGRLRHIRGCLQITPDMTAAQRILRRGRYNPVPEDVAFRPAISTVWFYAVILSHFRTRRDISPESGENNIL